MGKIIDKIRERRKLLSFSKRTPPSLEKELVALDAKKEESFPDCLYYSFEFFPPKTEAGLDNLLTRIERMVLRMDPLYIEVTWGNAGSTAARSMAVASHAQKYLGVEVMLHLTVQGTTRNDLERYLDQARSSGVQNILALRGDPPRGKRCWNAGDVSGGELDRAIDLVKLIRELHGDYFGIAVAGHPEGHPSSLSPEQEISDLKAKIDAGADMIVTQFFYQFDAFVDFVRRCRDAGIDCPIIPGIMPIQSYISLKRMTDYCGIAVPENIWERLEHVKNDDEAVKHIGCELANDMCRRILSEVDGVDGIHFYTLNLERSVNRILMDMGAIDYVGPTANESDTGTTSKTEMIRTATGRPLPWRPSAMANRSKEQIRPINWANRPKSYVMRTEEWDEFPNGRWGDATSPAFGELSDLGHFYSFSLGSEDDRRAMLGEKPKSPKDIYEVFANYVEGKIPHLPWCETTLQPESFSIQRQLASLNRLGFLTINSQPSVNGIPSTDKAFGWGGPGGYVYQKAYCECFCSPDNAKRLREMVGKHESMALYTLNRLGDKIPGSTEAYGATALTWGVFPNREIVQPTIFDPATFVVWAEEAFSLWTSMWLNLYDFDTESYELVEEIRDTYYLCAIINNNFMSDGMTIWEAMLDSCTGGD